MQLEVKGKRTADIHNYIGFKPEASVNIDPWDWPEPPAVPGGNLRLFFPREEWSLESDDYTSDIRPFDTGGTWSFTVNIPEDEENSWLSFTAPSDFPFDYKIRLIDEDGGFITSLRSGQKYALGAGGNVRRFKIVLGESGFVEQALEDLPIKPKAYSLAPNYPNPFNTETVITYQSPRVERVRLVIYDLLGQEWSIWMVVDGPGHAKAQTADSRGLKAVRIEEIKGKTTLWVLAIGVSKYAEETMNLSYADYDAERIAQYMDTQRGLLFQEVFTHVLVNEDATRANIIKAMTDFLGQAAPNDMVLIFLAGHGIQDQQTGSYYFLPHNANMENLTYEGLPMGNFDEAIRRLKTRVNKVVLWLDTCHAAAMQLSLRGLKPGEDLSDALSVASGEYMLSASLAGESALESEEFRLEGEDRSHGAFTYSLLRGLQGEAADENGVVWFGTLYNHITKLVPRLTQGQQHPHGNFRGIDLPLFIPANFDSSFVAQPKQSRPMVQIAPNKKKKGFPYKLMSIIVGAGAVGGAAIAASGGGAEASPPIKPPPERP